MDSFEQFEEKSLPPKEALYSKLTKSHVSDEDYEHAKKVWDAFECENLGITTISTYSQTLFYLQTCLKTSGEHVLNTTALTLHTTTQALA